MPSAANGKSEKPASSEAAADNSPVRQIMTVIEHKIRNLEKRKSKLTSYRDLQKAGKDLNADQKVAVAKYDEVAQTLEFARDLSKQVALIAVAAERDAKKQAKRDAWIRYASDTNKIREVLLVLDCLTQMGSTEIRDDFLSGSNGAVKLSEQDLKILDDLYSEVTPKHEMNEEGQPGFHSQSVRAADHLYSIIEGKSKEFLGTTYTHIKEIVNSVHGCGYLDKGQTEAEPEPEPAAEEEVESEPEPAASAGASAEPAGVYAVRVAPPPAAVVPAPPYPLRAMPPITLQEVEHAYFAHQYPQQRPIAEVIGSQNFFFLQESEIDSPVGTPQPPMMSQASPPLPIPTQTFTNQHFVPGSMPLPPQPHFPPHHEHPPYAAMPLASMPLPPPPADAPQPAPTAVAAAPTGPPPQPAPETNEPAAPEEKHEIENRSPERDDTTGGERKSHGQSDGTARFRRYGRGGRGGAPNGYRGGRGAFQSRQSGDYHETREYSNRGGTQSRQYGDSYRNRERQPKDRDHYYGNGDADGHHENGPRYGDSHSGSYKPRGGRGGPRPAPRGGAPRAPRPAAYTRKTDHAE